MKQVVSCSVFNFFAVLTVILFAQLPNNVATTLHRCTGSHVGHDAEPSSVDAGRAGGILRRRRGEMVLFVLQSCT